MENNKYVLLHWVDTKKLRIILTKITADNPTTVAPFTKCEPSVIKNTVNGEPYSIPFPTTSTCFTDIFQVNSWGKNLENLITQSETFNVAKKFYPNITALDWLNIAYKDGIESNISDIQLGLWDNNELSSAITPLKINKVDTAETPSAMAQIVKDLGGRYNYGYIVKHPRIRQHGIVINFHQQNNKLKYSVLRINSADNQLSQTSWVIDNIETITPINLSNSTYGVEADKTYIHTLLTQYNKSN